MMGQGSTRSSMLRHLRVTQLRAALLAVTVILLNIAGTFVLQDGAGASGTAVTGTGSSFAAPVMATWNAAVGGAPYDLPVSYIPSNSGTGRYDFRELAPLSQNRAPSRHR